MGKQRWVLKEFTFEEDGLNLLDLRRKVFSEIVPDLVNESAFAWEFERNPAGKPVCIIAQDRETLAGSYLVLPSLFEVAGKEMLLAQSVDTMTHPEYRGEGIFTNLAKVVYNKMETRGFQLVWGFPNDNSHPGFIKRLDWFDIDVLPMYVKPCQGRFWSTLVGYFVRTKVFLTTGQKVCKIENFSQDFDSLWERSKPHPPIIQIRDSKFLNWRYKTLETRTYDVYALYEKDLLRGYVVSRIMKRGRILGMAIVDVFPQNLSQSHFKALLAEVENESKHKKAALLFTYLPPCFTNHLKQTHFYRVPQILSVKKWHFGARVITSDLPLDFWRDKRNWYITYGDTEII